jgi:hypothetical protein
LITGTGVGHGLRPPFHADSCQALEFWIAVQQGEIVILPQAAIPITGLDGLTQQPKGLFFILQQAGRGHAPRIDHFLSILWEYVRFACDQFQRFGIGAGLEQMVELLFDFFCSGYITHGSPLPFW